MFGGHFEGPDEDIIGAQEECFDLKIQVQQFQTLMKFLEYSGNYTKFKTGVTKHFLENEFSKEQATEYMDLYLRWKMLSLETKDKAKIAKAEDKAKQLAEIEADYSYETIGALRQVAVDKHKLAIRKKREEADKDK